MLRNGARRFRERLADPDVIVLDGATGTELERRGIATHPPLWSARALIEAPESVFEIHCEHLTAGADLLTANTFRTHRRNLEREGLGARARELTATAVALARRAATLVATDRSVYVAGSTAPLEDCYRPDLVPPDHELAREHRDHAEHLAEAGVDAILIETMNSRREALAALDAARTTGLPVLLSFVCRAGAKLISGERLSDALADLEARPPEAVLVNCVPPAVALECVARLRDVGLPFGVYPNLDSPGFHSAALDPSEFAELAARFRDAGARLVGGCCGTTSAHTRAIAQHLRN